MATELIFSQNSSLQGKWETISSSNSPISRHENSFVRVKHKFYLLGGRGIKPVSIYNKKQIPGVKAQSLR